MDKVIMIVEETKDGFYVGGIKASSGGKHLWIAYSDSVRLCPEDAEDDAKLMIEDVLTGNLA